MKRWWVRLASYGRPQWPGLSVLLAIALIRVGLDALKPWPMKLIIDSVLKHQPLPPVVSDFAGGMTTTVLLTALTLATVLLFVAVWVLRVSESYVQTGVAARMRYALGAEVFERLQRLSLQYHGRRPTGDLVKRITADTNCVRELVMDVSLPLITSIASLIVMFVIMWRIDPLLSIVAVAAAPLQGLAIRRYAGPMATASWEQAERQGDVMAVAEQTLAALPVVRAFGREDDEDRRFREYSTRGDRAYLRSVKTQIHFKIGIDAVTALATGAVLAIGGMHVISGRLSVGAVVVFINYLSALYAPIETLAYLSHSLASASAGARRVFDVLDSKDEVVETPGARALAGAAGHVRFENVTAGYEPGRPVLRGIDLELQPGRLAAIVGPTGAGKTTLVSLIPRLLDASAGHVLLDGAPVRDLKLRSLRSQVSMVLQDAFVLPLTVAENIAYGRPNASRSDVIEAALHAQADEFIRKLPNGYDTILGERGATLSGGERQRIAIARAFLKNAPVLILDEPTAALDAGTESLLVRALEKLIQNRTTFVIAHRLSTVRRADVIFVVDEGRIVQRGKHDELLGQSGLYADLHAMQFERLHTAGAPA